MDHVGVLLVGLDGFELLVQFDGDLPIRCDAKSTFKKHLAVLGNNTCMHIVQVRSISHRFPSNRCCLACALTEKGRTLFEKRFRASLWSRNFRSRDCRWCNVYVRRARRPHCTSRPCRHCVRHRNTIRCRCCVHRCWCVAHWLPCCCYVRLVLVLIVVVNFLLVAVVVVNVSACRHHVPRHCRSLPSLVAVARRCCRCRRVRSLPSCPPLLCCSLLPSRCRRVNSPLLVVMPLKSRRSDCSKMKTSVWSQAK